MTQRITKANEWTWLMEDDNHRSWSGPEHGEAALLVKKYPSGELGISVRETIKRDKNIYIELNPDIAKSLFEFFNACASKPAANNSNDSALSHQAKNRGDAIGLDHSAWPEYIRQNIR
jgi:hypothetical protein